MANEKLAIPFFWSEVGRVIPFSTIAAPYPYSIMIEVAKECHYHKKKPVTLVTWSHAPVTV